MNGKTIKVLAVSTLLGATSAALGATTTDTFDPGSNTANWQMGADFIDPNGGNPGAHLHAVGLDTFGPRVGSDPTTTNDFTGNLRAKGVTSMGIDVIVNSTQFPIGGDAFSLTLLLRNTRGTPDDFSDDDFAWFAAGEIPQPGAGWQHYNFPLDAASTTLPAGWSGGSADDPENFRPGVTWNDIVTQADIVEFNYLKPGFFAIFQQWDTGVDNISVTSVPEPTSIGAIGLIGAGLIARRRR